VIEEAPPATDRRDDEGASWPSVDPVSRLSSLDSMEAADPEAMLALLRISCCSDGMGEKPTVGDGIFGSGA